MQEIHTNPICEQSSSQEMVVYINGKRYNPGAYRDGSPITIRGIVRAVGADLELRIGNKVTLDDFISSKPNIKILDPEKCRFYFMILKHARRLHWEYSRKREEIVRPLNDRRKELELLIRKAKRNGVSHGHLIIERNRLIEEILERTRNHNILISRAEQFIGTLYTRLEKEYFDIIDNFNEILAPYGLYLDDDLLIWRNREEVL